jgi:hypothetical protein
MKDCNEPPASRSGKRSKVPNQLLNGSTTERKPQIIHKLSYSMKTEAPSTLNFSAAC